VVELVHDERQVNPTHTGVITPGLAQAVGAKVTPQPHFLADRSNELPALTAFDRKRIIVVFWIEENEILRLLPYAGYAARYSSNASRVLSLMNTSWRFPRICSLIQKRNRMRP